MMSTSPSQTQPADETADQLRREMALVRRELGADITGVAAQARELTDWRSYIDKAPWVSAAVATAVGFMVVPRKLKVDSVDPATIAKLAKQNRIVVESKPKAAAKAGVGATAFSLIAGLIMRTTLSYATQKAADFISPDKPAKPPGAGQRKGAAQ